MDKYRKLSSRQDNTSNTNQHTDQAEVCMDKEMFIVAAESTYYLHGTGNGIGGIST